VLWLPVQIIEEGEEDRNMFDINKLSVPRIEGGGNYPHILYTDDNVAQIDRDSLYGAMKDFQTESLPDLNGNTIVPFTKEGKNELIDLITIFGVESASKTDRFGGVAEIDKNVTYNPNAQYYAEDEDGEVISESYGIMQIDVSGVNKTYVLLAMGGGYKRQLEMMGIDKDGKNTVKAMNAFAAEMWTDPEIKQNAIQFLKDPNNIQDHLRIAQTIYNDNGLNGWKAYSNYQNRNENTDPGFIDLYEKTKKENDQHDWYRWQDKITETNNKNKQEMMEILELTNDLPANITVEEKAKSLIAAYVELKNQQPEIKDHVDNKIEKIKPFAGDYGT